MDGKAPSPHSGKLLTVLFAAVVAVLAMPVSTQGDMARAQSGGTKVSIWDGVYTSAQSKRGEKVHATGCASCHGVRLSGDGQPDMPQSPAIAGTDFLHKWAGQTAADLFIYIRTKMPPDTPGILTDQDSIDALAHMLAMSDIPAGEKELPHDASALAVMMIEAKRK
jgi:cytochrome c